MRAYGFDYRTCGTLVSIHEQSPDIKRGVDEALETRGKADQHDQGAGDQGMMFGFACRETPELMPLPITLAHRIAQRLAEVRKEELVDYLRPDGKSQVTVEYSRGKPVAVRTVVVAAQHDDDVANERLRDDMIEMVVKEVIPAELRETMPKIHVNPTGRFVIGGPDGRRRPDRAARSSSTRTAAWHATAAAPSPARTRPRSTAPAPTLLAGSPRTSSRPDWPIASSSRSATPSASHGPISISIETFGTGKISDERILGLIDQPLRPAPGGDHRQPEPAPADLPTDGGLRPLRPAGPRSAVGAHRHGGRPGRRRRHAHA